MVATSWGITLSRLNYIIVSCELDPILACVILLKTEKKKLEKPLVITTKLNLGSLETSTHLPLMILEFLIFCAKT